MMDNRIKYLGTFSGRSIFLGTFYYLGTLSNSCSLPKTDINAAAGADAEFSLDIEHDNTASAVVIELARRQHCTVAQRDIDVVWHLGQHDKARLGRNEMREREREGGGTKTE